MITCQVRSQAVYDSSPSKSYAGLRILTSANWEPREVLSYTDDDTFICPKAFKAYIRQHVEKALRHCQSRGKVVGMLHVNDTLASVSLIVEPQFISGKASPILKYNAHLLTHRNKDRHRQTDTDGQRDRQNVQIVHAHRYYLLFPDTRTTCEL